MNAETRHILSEYLFNKSVEEELDNDELADLREEMESQVWGVFEDWENEEWERADSKLLRIANVYG